MITKLRKHPSFSLTGEGAYEGSRWAEFTIPADQWNPATGAKRRGRQISPEERIQLAERLAGARGRGTAPVPGNTAEPAGFTEEKPLSAGVS